MTKLKDQEVNIFFPEADQALADYFTISPKNWHTHTGIQILIATDGIGYYQEKGKAVQLLQRGNVVFILPNVEHWHIAAPQSNFTDVAIPSNTRDELVTWLQREKVSEYNCCQMALHKSDRIIL